MGLFDRIARGGRSASAAGIPSWPGLIPPLGSVQTASGQLVSQSTAMSVAAVYRAINVRATDVARCRPLLFTETSDGTRKRVKPSEHAVAALLVRPNRVQTWFEFCRDMMVAYLLRGNAYAAILRNRQGQPQELIYINPDAVMVLEASDGSWFYNVNRLGLFQMAMLRGFPTAIPAESVLHVRGISFNMLVAASTIGLARDAIGLAMAQNIQASRFVNNGARPSGVLQTDRKLSQEAATRLKDQWESYQGGAQNAGRTAVLEEGLKWNAVQLSATDLQFINQQQLSVQEIARFFGVPPAKLMQPEKSARGNAVLQQNQAYVNETIAPDLDMLEQRLECEFGLAEEGYRVAFDEGALMRADPATRFNIGRVGVLSGLISPNEFRRGEHLPPVPGGDQVRAPVNLAALGSDMTGTAPDGAGRPNDGDSPPPPVPNQKGRGGFAVYEGPHGAPRVGRVLR